MIGYNFGQTSDHHTLKVNNIILKYCKSKLFHILDLLILNLTLKTRRFMDEIVPIRRNQSINKYLDHIERFSIQPDIHLSSIPLRGHTFLNWSSGCCSYVDNFDQIFFEGILHWSELLWSCIVLFNKKKIILCCFLVFVFFFQRGCICFVMSYYFITSTSPKYIICVRYFLLENATFSLDNLFVSFFPNTNDKR